MIFRSKTKPCNRQGKGPRSLRVGHSTGEVWVEKEIGQNTSDLQPVKILLPRKGGVRTPGLLFCGEN